MTRFNDNKWYVWGAGWNCSANAPIEDATWEPDAVCETEEEAIDAANHLWETELCEDEQVLVYHNGCIQEDWQWWF